MEPDHPHWPPFMKGGEDDWWAPKQT